MQVEAAAVLGDGELDSARREGGKEGRERERRRRRRRRRGDGKTLARTLGRFRIATLVLTEGEGGLLQGFLLVVKRQQDLKRVSGVQLWREIFACVTHLASSKVC